MFNFFTNVYFLISLAIILFIAFLFGKNSWSGGVLSKEPSTLVRNNTFGIIGALFIIAVFFVFSWKAGIATVILAIIVIMLSGKMAMKKHIAKNHPEIKDILK